MPKFIQRLVIVGIVIVALFVALSQVDLQLKPPLRTWELESISAGIKKVEIPLTPPHRRGAEPYWDYTFGVSLPKGKPFDLVGEVKVYDIQSELISTLRFSKESVTESSWLNSHTHTSYLVSGDLNIEDGKEYSVLVIYEEAAKFDTGVVLHFLSKDDTKLPQSSSSN